MSFIQLPLTGASPYWGNAVASAGALPVTGDVTGQVILVLDTNSLYSWDGAAWQLIVDGTADVSGPGSSTDEAIARFDGTTGKVIQNSPVTINNAGDMAGVAALSAGSASLATPLPVGSGGTNSGTALSNNRVMRSSAGAVVEAAAITASRALVSDANGIPTHATTTATEIGYVNGVTSAIQTQIDAKAAGAASSTDNALARFDGATGKVLENSAVTLSDAGGMTFTGTTGFLRLPNLTEAQRDALTAAVGMLVFNTDTQRVDAYFNGAWLPIHGWGY